MARAGDLPDGPPASSLRSHGLEGNPGRGSVLDHHHDAGAGRSGYVEIAMKPTHFASLQQEGLTLILGLGQTGVAAARWCLRHGVAVRLADTREAVEASERLQQEASAQVQTSIPGRAQLDLRLGSAALDSETLDGVSRIVISPGLCPREAPLSAFLSEARGRGIEILGEIELFALALGDLAEQGYRPKVLAITGTNGKTTVTAMTRRLVEASGLTAVAAGNISPPALDALMQAMDDQALPDVWVLEVSSFQLESTFSLAVDGAAILNLSQDHLDWHGSMQAYASAKARLLRGATTIVLNRDDHQVVSMVENARAVNVRTFGHTEPQYEGDFGFEEHHGIVWLASIPVSEPELPTRRRKIEVAAERKVGTLHRLMPAEALRIQGQHNALNALAALALAQVAGGSLAAQLHALRDYAGEAHRCQWVRNVGGVDFINDSKGTNVGATVAALEGMGRPVILIAGGLGKGQDFAPLVDAIRAHAKAVVLIGQDAPLIGAALGDRAFPITEASGMAEAVEAAMSHATAGDIVLLSPACASRAMFLNYGNAAIALPKQSKNLHWIEERWHELAV